MRYLHRSCTVLESGAGVTVRSIPLFCIFRVTPTYFLQISDQPDTCKLLDEFFSQIDGLVAFVVGLLVKIALTSAADVVQLPAFLEAGYLEAAGLFTFAFFVDAVLAAIIQEANEPITIQALMVWTIGVAVPVTRPSYEPREALPTVTAQWARRFSRTRWVDRLECNLGFDLSHYRL